MNPSLKKPLSLEGELVRDVLREHDTFLIDCDGVLWRGSELVPRAIDTIDYLFALKKRVIFITNNSTKSRKEYVVKMTKMGFKNLTSEMIYCSSSLAAIYLQRKHPEIKKVYIVGEQGIEDEMREVGIEPLGAMREEIQQKYILEDDFAKIPLDPDVGAVVCGWDRRFSFLKLCKASAYLHNSHQRPGGCLFIATNRDAADKVTETRFIPGGGCMVAAIEASGVIHGKIRSRCTGKPDPWCVEMLEEQYKIDRNKTIIIGDRLDTDILLAQKSGIHSLFVLSGVNTLEDMRTPQQGVYIIPDYIADDLTIFLPTASPSPSSSLSLIDSPEKFVSVQPPLRSKL